MFSAYIDHRYEREEQILSALKTDPDEYKSTLTIVRTVSHIFIIYVSAYIDHRYEREEQILSVLKTDPDEYKSTLTIVRTVYQVKLSINGNIM